MNIAGLLNRAVTQAARVTAPIENQGAVGPQPTSTHPATAVNISDAARSLSNQSTAAEGREASELRDFLSKFDFRSITPRQLAQVGGALFERGEISEDAASAFVGVETNLVESLNPDKPIDVVQHFQHMLSVAAAANEKEPGYFDFAVKFRQEASKALDDTISFVSDGRSHITPTE